MTDTLPLRDYQREAIKAVFSAWSAWVQRPAVVLPTGAGKTVIFAHLTSQFIEKYGRRVVILVHRDELADQAINKIRAVAPHLRVGKVKAESDETDADVVVCSVQTLSHERRLARLHSSQTTGRRIGLVVVDECHHAMASTYLKILQTLGCFQEPHGTLAVGFTATLARGDGVGLGDVWEDVVYSRSFLYFVSRNYLTDVRGKSVQLSGLNLNSVKKSGGDFQARALGKALQESDLPDMLPKVYAENAGNRPGVVFTPTVETARDIANAFNKTGIRTAVISGETPREERQKIYADYRSGAVQVLSNCMVLTEGFDAPWASCAVIARPTQSQPLYIQMVGRVLRPWPGKKDALVLDVVGSGGKLATLVDLAPGQVESINENESIAEAADRENQEQNTPPNRSSHDLKVSDIDLFTGSSQAWLLTDKGVMFIPIGKGEVFLWPTDEGLWDVAYAPEQGKWERVRTALPLGMAQAWAETEAEERMSFNTGRDASWRKKKPSEKLTGFASRLNVSLEEAMQAGEISDRISVRLASKKFDRWVK